jgi:hypothetical protein
MYFSDLALTYFLLFDFTFDGILVARYVCRPVVSHLFKTCFSWLILIVNHLRRDCICLLQENCICLSVNFLQVSLWRKMIYQSENIARTYIASGRLSPHALMKVAIET